ncbi:MAG: pyridoxal phosphate-dependent aminotransferase [Candidatus Omnitrophota bacterium]
MKLSEKISTVEPSATLSITAKAKDLRASGEDVVVLAAGEPDFDTPQVVKEAAIKAIRDGYTKYTPAGGTKALKEDICRKLSSDNGLEYNASEIVVSNGAKHSLYNVLQVICNPGDEVLVIPPYWVSYPEMVKLAGASPKILPLRGDSGFKVRPEDIRSAVRKNTRALIINSPSNPAGVVYDENELREIAGVCLAGGITIISDEIYEKIIFDGKRHFSIAAVSDEARASTIVVNGLSKSHSMTGWRIGYMAGDKKVADMVSTLQSHSTSNPCSISQAAGECALTTDLEAEIERNRTEFQNRRDALMGYLSGEDKLRPFKPVGAFYLFCDISECGLDSFTFSQRLLEEKKVAVIPGGPFGDDRFIRISFATDLETIKKGIDRIKDWVKSL